MADPRSFVQQYAPLAAQVGTQIGVAPDVLLGKWGLETGWGKSVVPGTNNLGNIKGAGVSATDNMTGSNDQYKAYATPSDFGADYASLLQRKYPGAINTGENAQAFATALQKGGYAEDPQYASKVTGAVNTVRKLGDFLATAISGSAQAQEAPNAQKLASDPLWQMLNSGKPQAQSATPDAKLASDPTWQLLNSTQNQSATPANASPAQQESPGILGQIKGVGVGAAQSIDNLATGITQLIGHGVNSAGNALGVTIPGFSDADVKKFENDARNRQQEYKDMAGEAQTAKTVGNVAGDVLSGLAVPVGPAGTLLGRIGQGAAMGAGFGAAQPVLDNAGGYGENKLKQVMTGAAVGGAVPVAGQALNAAGNALRGIIGGNVSPQAGALAQRAADLGIDVSPVALSGSRPVQAVSSVLDKMPFSGAGQRAAATAQQFNRAVANTFGENATAITPDVMSSAQKRIGGVFDDVLSRNNVKGDNALLEDLSRIQQNASAVLPDSEAATVSKWINGALNKFQGNDMPGKAYQAFRTDVLLPAQKSSDPFLSKAAGDVREALDSALQRSLSGSDATAINTARIQYKNLKTIEDLAEKAPTGDISPALLLNQVRKNTPSFAYGGGGDLADLARIGQQFLKQKVPDSGTAERLMWLGAGAGGLAHLPATVASIGGGRMLNEALNSNVYRNLLLSALNGRNAAGAAANAAQPALMNRLAPYLIPPGTNLLTRPTQMPVLPGQNAQPN